MTNVEHTDEPDDDALVQRARGGDQDAFRALVERHEGRLHACARTILGDPREAEDVAQEAFLRAHRALDRFDGRAAFGTWLHRICVNASLDALRRRRDRRFSPPPPPMEPAGTDVLELRRRLALSLERLPPSLRVTVALVLVAGLSHAEAGEALGVAEGTVAWRVHEARRRLRALLAAGEGR